MTGRRGDVRARALSGDGGTITLWLLGLCVVLLFFGGISLDLWRAFSERRALAGLVDAAAIAGASGIDEQALRDHDVIRLDPPRAERLARGLIAVETDTSALVGTSVAATADGITVGATGRVDLTLLRVVMPDRPLTITVSAYSEPQVGSP